MPPRWKGRTCQAPISVSFLYSPSRSQAEQHSTLNQQAPETGLLSKEGPKPGVPRGPPGAGQSPCPVFTNPHNRASHPLCPTESRAACMQWGGDCAAHAAGEGLGTTHLSHCVLWDGGKVGGGEGEAAVCPCIMRVKIEDHLLLPAASLTQVQTVNAHKPVRARDDAHHEGHLEGTRRLSSCSLRTYPLLG